MKKNAIIPLFILLILSLSSCSKKNSSTTDVTKKIEYVITSSGNVSLDITYPIDDGTETTERGVGTFPWTKTITYNNSVSGVKITFQGTGYLGTQVDAKVLHNDTEVRNVSRPVNNMGKVPLTSTEIYNF